MNDCASLARITLLRPFDGRQQTLLEGKLMTHSLALRRPNIDHDDDAIIAPLLCPSVAAICPLKGALLPVLITTVPVK